MVTHLLCKFEHLVFSFAKVIFVQSSMSVTFLPSDITLIFCAGTPPFIVKLLSKFQVRDYSTFLDIDL